MKNSQAWFRASRLALIFSALGFGGVARSEVVSPQVAAPKIPATVIRLSECGGVGDGVHANTEAFTVALDRLAQQGGGRLVIPAGIWLTGPIKLRSNVELHLDRGALIQFSRDYRLYPLTVIDVRGDREVDAVSPISGENLENVAITGEGIIDGGGDAWRPVKKGKLTEGEWKMLVKSGGVLDAKGAIWWPSAAAMSGEEVVSRLRKTGSLNPADYEAAHPFLRPKMVRLIGCKKLLLEGITFQNPPNWTLNPVLCEDVSIIGVVVHNSPAAQNSDALDLESCRRAIVRGCVFDTGDDGICIKSGKDAAGRLRAAPTEDVLIEGCTVYHAHGGFTIGSEMSGGVRNLRVTNCTFIGTDIGLRFKSRRGRGGVVEKIFISNVRMTGIVTDAISFSMAYGGASPTDEGDTVAAATVDRATEETPQFRDIRIENVVCRGALSAMTLNGLPELPLSNILLRNIDITAQKGVAVADAEGIRFENVRVQQESGEAVRTQRVKDSTLKLTP